ncbi:helix-turn-helix domain-containing protein [Cnuibacter physcomitrellae]|uniref:Ada metal-binding domain-containing protein n=1 Tax=Cnuibacter physcomitrellae TaxID=1619308 RepID=UPI002175D2E7|nr:Ada metal-binding domain-containing protein [Cnuibacter physcomitrellae]MCS5498788.1 helix-turn-helix domain-containing protein [Cnuibacter physcomitrellae]
MDFSERYRIIQSRDARFDGQFITAVRSTGIYCRPSCPARTPKEANITFYETSAAAHEAGYRACKRCLPEAVPGTPAWNLRDDLAGRAMRLIADGVVEREGVGGLSRRLGYSERHVARVLTEQLGAGPLALARAHRAQAARTLLTSTGLSMAEVAFAAGFASIRQFNDTVSEVFEQTPSQLRARYSATGDQPGGSVRLSLPAREPFDAAGVFAWLAARAVPGVEIASADSYTRSLALPGGPAWFTVTATAGGVALEAHLSTLSDLSTLVARVRRLFDLDADPVAVDAALVDGALVGGALADGADRASSGSALAAAVRSNPGIRLPGTVDPAEMLVRAMVGQQISVAAARTHLSRLAAVAGRPLAMEGGPELLFPDPAAIAEHAEAVTGPRARLAALRGAAEAMASGSLVLTSGDAAAEQRAALLAMPGIGPWTAGYVSMRVLGAPDVLLTGDVALRTGAAVLGAPSTPRELARWAEDFAPWRSYLSLHLWRAALTGSAAPRRPGESAPPSPAPSPDAAPAPSPAPSPDRLPTPSAPPPGRAPAPAPPPAPGRRRDPHPASPHPRTTRPLTKESS